MSYNLDPKKLSKDEWLLANCKERSLYLIEYSPKTEKQLRDKLKSGEKYTDDIIDKTIEFLKKYKYIDDESLARRYIELNKNNYSKRIIFQKLYQKGVNRELIDKLKKDEDIFYDEDALCKKLLKKKCPDYKDIKDDMDVKAKQKIYAYLLRKGISYEVVSRVLKLV